MKYKPSRKGAVFISKQYDVIVVGAGNGGLAAGGITAKNGLSTLVLERHNIPGGAATSFRRGRFEFETSLHELAEIGHNPFEGTVRQLFDTLGASDIDWKFEENAFRVILPGEGGYDAILPTGEQAFIDEMERQVPGCRDSVKAVFDLGRHAMAALEYLSKGAPDPQVLMTEYADFMRIASHSTQEVLDALGMPKRAQDILVTYWCYLGAPADQLDFLYYALMLILYVELKPAMPTMRSHEMSLALEKAIRDNGGEIWYNSEVEKILVKDGKAYGVVVDGKEIYANHIICNSHMGNALSKLLPEAEIPESMLKLANARDLALSFVTVYLGMNRSAEELGIHDYSNFVIPCADSREQYNRCCTIENSKYAIMNCLNTVIPDSSPEGTCTLFFTTMYYGDVWKDVKPEEYKKLKIKIAGEIIETCEEALGISLKPYIEEIVIAAPPTFARYLNTPRGTPYGYQFDMWDSMMVRTMNVEQEEPIQNLWFCGACGERGDGYSSSYISGMNTGLRTVRDAKEGK